MKNFLLSSLFLAVLAVNPTTGEAKNYVHKLPLQLESEQQFDSISHSGSAKISWKALNQITALKTTSNTQTGESSVFIAFDDVPGILKLEATSGSATCIKNSHNYLEVSESADNKTFENPHTLQANSSQNISIALKPTTRFIKLTFKVIYHSGFISGSFCGHEFDPIAITLPKSIDFPYKNYTIQGIVGAVKDTISVNYSNLSGPLQGRVNSDNFMCRKISDSETPGSAGVALFEVSYLATEATSEKATLTVIDSGNDQNLSATEIEAIATINFIPTSPINIKPSKIGKSFFDLAWQPVVGEIKHYRVRLINSAGELLTEKLTETPNCHFEKLIQNQSYQIEITTIASNGNESQEAAIIEVTTNIDFGDQLANAGFEVWEGNESDTYGAEPLHWNSFATLNGLSLAQAKQLTASPKVRPGSTGSHSALVYSRLAVFNIPANGNMTTGRINAGSITATDYANHNFTDPDNPHFHQIITDVPDSASVWIFFKPGTPTNSNAIARMSFILHGENEDRTEPVREPAANVSPLIRATAAKEYSEHGEWIRFSVPFEKLEPTAANTPKYMLASFTTNKTPGVSSGGIDSVYVDDIVLIYKPELTAGTPSAILLQEGEEFDLPYTLTGSMSVSNLNAAANTVYAELSDHNGSFDTPTIVSEVITTDESGVLHVKLPENLISGNEYRIRVVTTNYPMTANAAEFLQITGSVGGTSLTEAAMSPKYVVYPNPAKDRIYIRGAKGASYHIRNIANRSLLANTSLNADGIDISGLTPGVYFIEIKSGRTSQILKFIKE